MNSESKKRINTAFRDLRKKGYFAKQNIADCNSCGWAEVPEDKKDKAVFTHYQSLGSDGKLYLNWSGNGTEICDTFSNRGLTVEWNGSDTRKIIIS